MEGNPAQRTRERLRVHEKLQFPLMIATLALEGAAIAVVILVEVSGDPSGSWRFVLLSVIVLVLGLAFAILINMHLRNRVKRRLGPERGMWDLEYDPAFRQPWWRRN